MAGRYTLERELGRGGMATVWLVRDLKHDRPVALKVMNPAATAGTLLRDLEQGAAKGRFGPFALAVAYTGLGETDRALAALHQAIDRRDIFLPEVFFDPVLHPLRGDPRFRRVEERMGLSPRSPSSPAASP